MSSGALLSEFLIDLEKAVDHLRHSEKRIAQLPHNWADLSSDELEIVDAFTSRLARGCAKRAAVARKPGRTPAPAGPEIPPYLASFFCN